MFCPAWYSHFFHGFEIWKKSKFCAPHFSFDTPRSGQKWMLYVLSSTLHVTFSWIGNLKIFQVLSSLVFFSRGFSPGLRTQDTFWLWLFTFFIGQKPYKKLNFCPELNLTVLTISNSDNFQIWQFPTLTISNSGNFQLWQFPSPTISYSDNFQLCHFPILTLSDSDPFRFLPLSFVLHTFLLIYLSQDCKTFSMFCPPHNFYFFMDMKFENIPSFVLNTFHLIHLAHDTYTFFMDLKFEKKIHVLSSTLFNWYTYLRTVINSLHSVQILLFFLGLEIWKHSKFYPPHFSIDIPSIIKVSMLNSVLSVSTSASLVHTTKMAFRGNYKFENRAGSKALI